MKSFKKMTVCLISLCLMLSAVLITPSVNAKDVPPYDYGSFMGNWHDTSRGISLEVLNTDNQKLTFYIPAFFPAEYTYPIVNNQVTWLEHSAGINFQHSLTFYDDSIHYVSISGTDKFECWFTSDTIKPCRIETENYSVVLNGKQLEFDQPPVMCNDRILVPMRKIFEELGANIDYNSYIDTIPGHYNAEEIEITATTPTSKLWLCRRWFGDWQYSVYQNGEYTNGSTLSYSIGDALPIIVNDRTLVPVRLISEALGADVEWNNETQTVIITIS